MAVDHIIAACSEVECITDTDCTTIVTELDGQPGNKPNSKNNRVDWSDP